MAIQFPLEMKDGKMVRDIIALRKHFDINKVLNVFLDGRLLTWLESRGYDEEFRAISELSKADAELAEKICNIFMVQYVPTEVIDVSKIIEKNERIQRLMQYTEEIEDKIERVAFNQEELSELIHNGNNCIYLLGKKFLIPLKENIKYIGLNCPEISFASEETIHLFHEGKIKLINIKFGPDCEKISKWKKYHIEARPTKFYKKDLNEKFIRYDDALKMEYLKENSDNIFEIYNTPKYVEVANCCYMEMCKAHTPENKKEFQDLQDENGKYDMIMCLYKVFDDNSTDLLFGKMVGIKRYTITEKYVFFTGCFHGYDVLYVFNKLTEKIKKIKDADSINLIDAFEDKCIYHYRYRAVSSSYVDVVDINGNAVSHIIKQLDAKYHRWFKNGKEIYEGFVYDGIYYYAYKRGMMALNLNDSTSTAINNDDLWLDQRIFVENEQLFFCQNTKIYSFDLKSKSLDTLVNNQALTEIIKVEANRIIYIVIENIYTRIRYELCLDTMRTTRL